MIFTSRTHSQPALRGEDVLVIEPGSRYLRIGLASQGLPRTVPHVLARRYRPGAPFDGGELCGLFEELPAQVCFLENTPVSCA